MTYKTAWRMFNQIRKLMADEDDMHTGEIEVDETYLGPNTKMRTTAKPYKSQILFGMVEREGRS